MSKTLIVARHEFSVTVRRYGFLVATSLIPIIGLLGMIGFLVVEAGARDREPDRIAVGYVDRSGLFTRFQEQELGSFRPFPDERAGTDALLSGGVAALYVISPNYLETGEVTQISKRQPGIPEDEVIRKALDQFLRDNLLADQLPPARLARIRDLVRLTIVEVDETGEALEDPVDTERFAFFFGVAVLVMMSVMFTSGYLLRGLSEEKESRIMEVLLSSVTSDQLILGKLLGLGAAGLLQITVWISSGVLIFLVLRGASQDLSSVGFPSPILFVLGLLYFLLGYALIATLLGAMGAVTSSLREAQHLTLIVVMPSILPFWLSSAILADPNHIVVRLLSFIPITAPTTSLVRLALDSMSALDLTVSLSVLTVGVLLTVVLTLRIFRAYLLMYGQRPNLHEIARALTRG